MRSAGQAIHRAAWPAGVLPFLVALPALAASAAMPWHIGWMLAVAVIVVLGVPHGALDVEIGRTLFRPRFGWAWFPVFAVPYLGLVAIVLGAWQEAPALTLAAFLGATVWHFGTEETGAGGLPAIVRGGLPIAVPVLAQPDSTARVLATASGPGLAALPTWLVVGSLAWLLAVGLWLSREGKADLRLPAALAAGFAVLPPLTAFALYFVSVHAPAHVEALIARHPSSIPRVQGAWSAWWRAVPATILTVLVAAALWPFYPGETPVRLVGLMLQLLAALTLPHMLLHVWLDRRERRAAAAATVPQVAVIVRASSAVLALTTRYP